MPLSWNEIRDRAVQFSRNWADESREDAEAKSFWDGFFDVFGITRRRLANFEAPVRQRRDGGKTSTGYIDLFWKGVLLVEHKSRGKDLDRAYAQAIDYFPGIAERDLPRYILVSDFARLRLYDLEANEQWEFTLKELHKHIRLFGFIAGYETRPVRPQDPVNQRAAERMGRLHDKLKASGYEGHALEVLLVRLLFCLFADDTAIFPPQALREWLESDTADDGHDLGAKLAQLFGVLNTPLDKRQTMLDERIAAFPYVNGKLFAEFLPIPAFDTAMRNELLDACALDWGRISPAIFGGLFQSIMDPKARRNLGAHYTSEQNILKLIEPLFLDELRAEFQRCKGNANKLFELQKKLRRLTFLDPACGCGNFLVVAYRELRQLELDILRIARDTHTRFLNIFSEVQVNVDQFYGIEIEEFPAQIAQVALWLTDHQMNQKVSEEFGQYYARLPLTVSATIVHGNALQLDWDTVVPRERLSFILGNPPFVGKKEQSKEQKAELLALFKGAKSAGVLDYVCGWYLKAADMCAENAHQSLLVEDGMDRSSSIRCAFVSTNSITQGEQPGVLWPELWKRGMKIHFAHRTFQWNNEGRGKAAVHCVIIGFGSQLAEKPVIYDYEDVRGEAHPILAQRINPYLVDADGLVLQKRTRPLMEAPEMDFGSKAADFGHLTLTPEDRNRMVAKYPQAAAWIKEFIGAEEFINGTKRYCLWLKGFAVTEFRPVPEIMERIARVRDERARSIDENTRKWASLPALFQADRQPTSDYLLIPKVSSERRKYVPLGFCSPALITNPTVLVIPGASIYHFGVLQSLMHIAWMSSTCGRMKSDYQYSNTIVYNNFPWPETPSEKQKTDIETCAQKVLDARTQFPEASLADLYDPLTMPPVLVKAHQTLDRAVDTAYGFKGKTDAERVAFLFTLYQKYTSLSPVAKKPLPRRKKTTRSVGWDEAQRNPSSSCVPYRQCWDYAALHPSLRVVFGFYYSPAFNVTFSPQFAG